MQLRPRGTGDGDALWALLGPVFRAGDSYAIEADIPRDDAIAYWTGPPNRVWIAFEDDTPLGTCYLRPNQRGGGAHVANAGFVTAPDARGRGVARAMLAHAEAEARASGFLAIQFNFVVSTNRVALHIWDSADYARVGTLPRAFRHPTEGLVDAFVMMKSLAEEPACPTTDPSSPS